MCSVDGRMWLYNAYLPQRTTHLAYDPLSVMAVLSPFSPETACPRASNAGASSGAKSPAASADAEPHAPPDEPGPEEQDADAPSSDSAHPDAPLSDASLPDRLPDRLLEAIAAYAHAHDLALDTAVTRLITYAQRQRASLAPMPAPQASDAALSDPGGVSATATKADATALSRLRRLRRRLRRSQSSPTDEANEHAPSRASSEKPSSTCPPAEASPAEAFPSEEASRIGDLLARHDRLLSSPSDPDADAQAPSPPSTSRPHRTTSMFDLAEQAERSAPLDSDARDTNSSQDESGATD